MFEPNPRIAPIEVAGYTLDVHTFLERDYDDISQASVELPTMVEYLNVTLQILAYQRDEAKATLKQLEAKKFFDFKNGALQSLYGASVKTTDSAVDRAIDADAEVLEARKALGSLDGWVQRLKTAITNFQAKLELTRTAEATRRKIES